MFFCLHKHLVRGSAEKNVFIHVCLKQVWGKSWFECPCSMDVYVIYQAYTTINFKMTGYFSQPSVKSQWISHCSCDLPLILHMSKKKFFSSISFQSYICFKICSCRPDLFDVWHFWSVFLRKVNRSNPKC